MATCLQCGGSKHIFINVRLKLYADGSLTRIYVGKCTACDPRGQIDLKPDHKQAQAGEREVA
jgi:hypothetical protein